MITIQNPLTFTSSYPPKRLGAISDLLFFDIETTGSLSDRLRLARRKHLDSDPVFCRDEGCGGRGSRRFFCTSPDEAHPRPFQRRRV